ncbi:hypothetical protein [Enterococcus sp. AZ188]|uniref:hypothetical protein n=1 Tax=Enterococcus sp. AZ188 TaxID=2774678 RepID=UPI003D2FE549
MLNHQDEPEIEALSSISKSGVRILPKMIFQIVQNFYNKNYLLKSGKEKNQFNHRNFKIGKRNLNIKKKNQNVMGNNNFFKRKVAESVSFTEKKQEVILRAKMKNADMEIKIKNKIQTKKFKV